jgi:hypothetical protein
VSHETLKLTISYIAALGIIAGTYYALVLFPYQLDTDVKLWLTGAAGGALAFLFGDQVATRAFSQGLQTPTPPKEENNS